MEFVSTHNKALPTVDNIIQDWEEPDDIINILKEEKKWIEIKFINFEIIINLEIILFNIIINSILWFRFF